VEQSNYKVIDSLFDFELQLDAMMDGFDPDIKQTTIDNIKAVCVESFKIGLAARMMPVNKNGGVRQ